MKQILLIITLTLCISSWAQPSTIETEIHRITKDKHIKIGIAIKELNKSDAKIIEINGSDRFPMQSVFKLHLSIAVLQQIDQGKLNLTDSIHFDKSELYTHLWSPIQKQYPDGNINLPLSEVLRYTIQQSDNSGCDKLLKLIGGAHNVTRYIHSIGIENINIENNEFELQSDWQRQFNNWTTPMAAIELLEKIDQKSLLTEPTQQFLWQTMLSTSTGSIRNLLPKDAQVAYKTGFSGRNDKGETAANNNIGILIRPDGSRVAYAIFITESTEEQSVNYDIIAQIGNTIFKSNTK